LNSAATILFLKGSDESVFRDVYFEHYQRVYTYVLKKTGSSYLAEETLQLSFLKLWNYRSSLNEDLPLVSQIFRIVRTTMIDLVRKEQARKLSMTGFTRAQPAENACEDTSYRLEENELKRALSAVLSRMPAMQKKVFVMNRFEGRSYQEIAQMLSISVRTVETHISRALKFLRENLGTIVLFLLLKK
jgi:RNA polymerase sigma-70 factor (ECF subfamily)